MLLKFSKLQFPSTAEEMLYCNEYHVFKVVVESHCTYKTSSSVTGRREPGKAITYWSL